MRALLVAATLLAMLCTTLATLTGIVFCLGMGANASPTQVHTLKLWMTGLSLLGAAGIAGGIALWRAGQLGWAAGVSGLPALIMGILFLASLLR